MSLLDRVRFVRNWRAEDYRPFYVEGRRVGWIAYDLARRLADFPKVFVSDGAAVAMDRRIAGYDACSAAFAEVLPRLVESGHVRPLRGEYYPLVRAWQEVPLARVDRPPFRFSGSAPTGCI